MQTPRRRGRASGRRWGRDVRSSRATPSVTPHGFMRLNPGGGPAALSQRAGLPRASAGTDLRTCATGHSILSDPRSPGLQPAKGPAQRAPACQIPQRPDHRDHPCREVTGKAPAGADQGGAYHALSIRERIVLAIPAPNDPAIIPPLYIRKRERGFRDTPGNIKYVMRNGEA